MSGKLERNVAVLGLGLIGGVWARHLESDGRLAATWNRTPRPDSPRGVGSPLAAAEQADVLIVVVSDPAAVEAVVRAMTSALSARHLVIQSSTIGPADSTRVRGLVEACGARYLEAPFTGSQPAAEARQTVYYLGGAPALIAEAEPVLARLSAQRFHIGSGEQACALKLAMNLQIATLTEALCEALQVARAAGIADDVFFECMRGNVAWSGLAALKEPKLRAGDYAPQFSVKHLLKDLRLLQQHAGPRPALDTVITQLQAAVDHGQADQDFIALYEQVRR